MRRKITIIIIMLCLTLLAAAPAAVAAGDICFTAIYNTLEPLDDNTMPAIIGGLLYIPSGFFPTDELGVYYLSGDNKILLYNPSKRLLFDLEKNTVVDQNNEQYKITAVQENGLIYLPVDEVCNFFGLTYHVITGGPAPIVRFYTGSVSVDDSTFLSLNWAKMHSYFDAYVGNTPNSSAPPAIPSAPSFENVSVYLSFYDLEPKNFETILNTLDLYQYKCCFFVSADEIATDADLLRRAAGTGHMIGIWLKEGTFDEYQKASSLLFEAAKIRTLLVSVGSDTITPSEATAKSKGLVFWKPTKNYNKAEDTTFYSLKEYLSALNSSRVSMNFSCTDTMVTVTQSFFGYLSESRYSVGRITETTAPTYSIG